MCKWTNVDYDYNCREPTSSAWQFYRTGVTSELCRQCKGNGRMTKRHIWCLWHFEEIGKQLSMQYISRVFKVVLQFAEWNISLTSKYLCYWLYLQFSSKHRQCVAVLPSINYFIAANCYALKNRPIWSVVYVFALLFVQPLSSAMKLHKISLLVPCTTLSHRPTWWI